MMLKIIVDPIEIRNLIGHNPVLELIDPNHIHTSSNYEPSKSELDLLYTRNMLTNNR